MKKKAKGWREKKIYIKPKSILEPCRGYTWKIPRYHRTSRSAVEMAPRGAQSSRLACLYAATRARRLPSHLSAFHATLDRASIEPHRPKRTLRHRRHLPARNPVYSTWGAQPRVRTANGESELSRAFEFKQTHCRSVYPE